MKNSKQKIVIFGGSFDPIHFGHTDIVTNLEKSFDKVIVVPSYISPFKTGAYDGAERFKLCKKVFTSNKTEVSRYEINKKGVSYSVDTATYFSKKYKDAKLFWALGSEELIRLAGWKNIDVLKKLVTFFVVPRPGFEPKPELLQSIKKNKIKIKFAKFVGLDISSTQIKIDMAFGSHNRFVPSAVYEYSIKHDLFNPYGKYVQKLYEYGLDDKRIRHTKRTAERGVELAKKYGGSVKDTVIACILHDIAKAVNAQDYIGRVDISGYPAPTAHAPIGAYIAKQEFDVSDEICKAIEQHSTADENMSLLSEIVYLADKTEAGRSYRSLDKMLYLCSLDKNVAMLEALREIGELESSDKCEMSARALKYYEKLCGGIEIPEYVPRTAQIKTVNLPIESIARSAAVAEIHKASAAVAEVHKGSSAVAEVHKTSSAVVAASSKAVSFVPESSKALRVSGKPNKSTGDGIKDIAYAVAEELDLHKARDIDIVDLNGKTIIADYFVIASASSTTAVKALTDYVEDRLKKQFDLDPIKRDADREWVALDFGSVIIHIFTDKTREFYNIERLWSDGSNITRFGE